MILEEPRKMKLFFVPHSRTIAATHMRPNLKSGFSISLKKIASLSILFFFALLLFSPLMGWHVHHECMARDEAHRFEFHFNDPQTDHHHGNDCGSEFILNHIFENGTAMARADSDCFSIPLSDFDFYVLPPLFALLANQVAESWFFEQDPEGGGEWLDCATVHLRAPPFRLS